MTAIEKSWKESGLLEGLSAKKRIIASKTLEECARFLIDLEYNYGQADYFIFCAISRIIRISDKKINVQDLYNKIKIFAKVFENISNISPKIEEELLYDFCEEYASEK
jgi:hypothetical protein